MMGKIEYIVEQREKKTKFLRRQSYYYAILDGHNHESLVVSEKMVKSNMEKMTARFLKDLPNSKLVTVQEYKDSFK